MIIKMFIFVCEYLNFEIYGSNKGVQIRRKTGERVIPQCTKTAVKHGDGNIRVWRVFSSSAHLHRINSIVKKVEYQSI